MDSEQSALLNRFFSQSTFQEIVDYGRSDTFDATLEKYIKDYWRKTNRECISDIYQVMRKKYQNEYYYKNTLLNKLLFGVHSPRTTTALTEIPISHSKADFILINGKAVVYEIKTSLDTLDRLEGQIEDYYKAFSRVSVVTSESHLDEVTKKIANKPVGIYVLTSRNTLRTQKLPEEFIDELSNETMFKVLRKTEFEDILLTYYGKLPTVSPFDFYSECLSWFENIPTMKAYNYFVSALKRRSPRNDIRFSEIPYEIKFLIYFSKYQDKALTSLKQFLQTRRS